MKYTFRHLNDDSIETLTRSLEVEFKQIELVLSANEMTHLDLKIWYEEPDKIYEGLMVIADGTTWDPATIALGSYLAYYSGTVWRKVG